MSRPAKKAKNDLSEHAPLPPQLANTTLSRFIDLDSFVQARQFELNHFLQVLEDKAKLVGKTKQGFQTLPKHMRRRAMSHNTYRIPARVRVREESAAKVKRGTRKRRRRPSQILKDYCNRDKQHTWLETHIWHAKRMYMEARWGYKVAATPHEKGERACYRFAGNDCTVYDASYYVCLKVKAAVSDFATRCTTQAVPARVLQGVAAWDTLLFRGTALVAPVTVVLVDAQTFVLIVHPAAYAEAKALVTQHWSVEDLKDQVVHYELRGPRSLKVIADSVEVQEQRVSTLLQEAAAFNAYQFPANTLLGFSFKQLSAKGPMVMTARSAQDQGFEGGFVPLQQSPELVETLLRWPAELSTTALWGVLRERQVSTLVPHKITTRSRTCRFPPRECKPADKQQEQEEDESSASSGDESPMEANYLPAVLVFRNSPLKRGLGSGWDLLAPAGYGTALWRRLVYAGGKPTGLREHESLRLEQGVLSFPRDYPTTQAYRTFSELEANQRKGKFDRTPSAHRVNPERLGFPCPFAPRWDCLGEDWSALQPVRIKAYRRRPAPGSVLCLPLPDDLRRNGPAHEESLHERTLQPRSTKSAEVEAACAALSPEREVIGFVTSGAFSHVRGKGYGIGFVARTRWNGCDSLLFRSPSTRCYHLALVTPLEI